LILHEVLTTEKVPFRYRVAGLGSRLLAWLIDACVGALLLGMGALVMLVLEVGRAGLGQAVFILWLFALRWGYFLAFEWLWQGQTPGKRILGIRVIRADGTAPSFAAAAVRNLVRAVDALPVLYGLGFAVAAGNPARRRLGDLAADTLVVHVERRAAPLRVLPEAVDRPDRARLPLLRQRLAQLDRAQKQALLDLCLRRDELQLAERARLFGATAAFVQERLGLAPEPHESPEKFILQLAVALEERAAGGPEPGERPGANKP
jgi:uncharacterized RDD family membrane protein YckC